jgi:hypothetical protein
LPTEAIPKKGDCAAPLARQIIYHVQPSKFQFLALASLSNNI